MKRREFFAVSTVGSAVAFGQSDEVKIRITLDPGTPSASVAQIVGTEITFPVGFGKHGFLPAGESFKGGYSLLGDFAVNAILSEDRFEMTDALVVESGKSRKWLAENLFQNMSSIDFDGDGSGGEYGSAFIGLEPLGSTASQPFHFGEYKGVFRWYSYAVHGTQEEERVGKCVTGGCVNVRRTDLELIINSIELGDRVKIRSV